MSRLGRRIAAHLADCLGQSGPETDTSDLIPATSRPLAVPDRLMLHLSYADSQGEISQRAVLLHRVERNDQTLYLRGHCYLRERMRLFRADRILSLHNGRTGNAIPDPVDFLTQIFDAQGEMTLTPLTRLRQGTRPIAVVAMALARADASLHPAEEGTIGQLLADASGKMGLDVQERQIGFLYQEFTAIVPSQAMITRATGALMGMNDPPVDPVQVCRQMIEADGRVAAEEVDLYRQIVTKAAKRMRT